MRSTILVTISETGEGRTSPLQEPEGRSSVSGRGSCKGRRSSSAINGCKCCTVCRQAKSPLQRRARLATPAVREVATLSSSRVAAPAARALSVVSARFLHGQRVKSSFLSVHGSCTVDEPRRDSIIDKPGDCFIDRRSRSSGGKWSFCTVSTPSRCFVGSRANEVPR